MCSYELEFAYFFNFSESDFNFFFISFSTS